MDIEKAKRALINADAAGDTAAAKQIANYIKSQQSAPQPVPAKPQDSFSQIGKQTVGAVEDTRREIQNLENMRQGGEISGFESGFRKTGQVAKALGSLSAGALNAADYALGRIPSSLAQGAAGLVGQLPVAGKAENLGEYTQAVATDAAQGYGELEQKYPRTMGMVGAAGNILSVAPMGALSPSKALGKNLTESGLEKARAPIRNLVQEPLTEKAVIKAQEFGRDVKTGAFGKKSVALSPVEERAASLVEKIPALKSPLVRSPSKKAQIINQEANKISSQVSKNLGKFNNIKFKDSYLKQEIFNKARADLSKDMTFLNESGELVKGIDDHIKQAEYFVAQNPKTLQGLLNARRQFDTYISGKTANPFDANYNTAAAAKTNIRSYLNDFIKNNDPTGTVEQGLADSSALFDAADNIRTKVAKDFVSQGEGLMNSLNKNSSLKATIIKSAAGLGGAGAVTAGAFVAPTVAAAALPWAIGAGGLYIGGKLLNTAQSRKLIGAILKNGGDVVDAGARSAMLDYMEELQNQDEEILKMPAKDVIKSNEGKR